MADSSAGNMYQVEVKNFVDARLSKAKVMVCQLDFDQMKYSTRSRLHFVNNEADNHIYLRRFLNIASSHKVDLLVFPELTIPSEYVKELYDFSKQYDIYIVGGTYYKDTGHGFLSICPIVTPSGIYNTEKITPSPFETSSFNGGIDGAIPGKVITVFRGTKIGDFAVTICLDYINDSLRNDLGKYSLDFLIVTAFNSQSSKFYSSMDSDVQWSPQGLYIIYCNTVSKELNGDGRSALFAFMDNCYKTEFKDKGCTDLNPENKVYEFGLGKSYCIFEVDLEHKKPYVSKNGYTKTNVQAIEENTAQMEERYLFLKSIKASEDKYLYIDKYYIKPREYDEMVEVLDKEHVLVITGDPGIGKTYTAIKIMQEYHKKGFHPTWFYGLAKEDRDAQKEYLLNFEPKQKDIVYLEDPFGRTLFENREELKTLFANWVEKFRACNAKLIITSRAEVFKQFEKEVLSGDKLEAYQKELNVRKPSYATNDLKNIAIQYIRAYTSWANNVEWKKAVFRGIEKKQLISPLMIYNLIKNYSQPIDILLFKNAIREAKTKDMVTQFADEIKMLSNPAKILLYLVLLCGKKNILLIRKIFTIAQGELLKKTPFEGSSFNFELKGQDAHRIQCLGGMTRVYRFSHPTYEEALIRLAEKDATCALITETCLTVILNQDSSMAADIFRRYVMRCPTFLESFMIDILKKEFEYFEESTKLDLIRKILSSRSSSKAFQETARQLFPIKKVLEGLYLDVKNELLVLRFRMLNRRKEELEDTTIEWERVFTTRRICELHPSIFLTCYDLAYVIDEQLIMKIEGNFQKEDVIKKFILLPTERERNKFDEILSGTVYKGLYADLKDKIPDDILGERINVKDNYVRIFRKYILRMDKPKGIVYLDFGAMMAVNRNAKIYPIGVVDVEGEFENGDIVYLVNRESHQKFLSRIELSSEDIKKYKRLHSGEIYEMEDKIISTVISRPYFREQSGKRFMQRR